MDEFGTAIIGAGVIGLAVARQLSLEPAVRDAGLVILEQEAQFGQHTSSRNSEVIHAGIYYPEDSLKARLCVRGKALLYDYCDKHGIQYRRTGKLIVAGAADQAQLEELLNKGKANGVNDLQHLTEKQLQKREPDVRGRGALLSPSSGILDSHGYMQTLLNESQSRGALFAPLTRVTGVEVDSQGYIVNTGIRASSSATTAEPYRFRCRALVNCAGLAAPDIGAEISRLLPSPELPMRGYYCKGDYFTYQGPARFSHLVYPLPEPGTRGLGIHATLDLGGQIRFGPDAHYVDALDYRVGTDKIESFVDAIRRYLPSIEAHHLQAAYAGIRPKLAGPGEPAADFRILPHNGQASDSLVHLLGIESPGLTASLAIAEEVQRCLVAPS